MLDLLAAGADENSCDYSSTALRTPLAAAVSNNNERMVGFLLAAGADSGKGKERPSVGPKGLALPVIIAVEAGHCGPLKRLLVAGANASVVNFRGESALRLACLHCHEGAVELLLRHNASLTSRCDGCLPPPPEHGVVAMGKLDRRVLRHNASLTSCCDNGCLPPVHDVVAMGVLVRRERSFFGRRRYPSTLNDVETAAADRIHGMLHAASAWGRRGWLIMMRARRVAAVDDSSLEKPSPAEQVSPRNDDETAVEPIDRGICVAVEGLMLFSADVPSTDTSGGSHRQEKGRATSTKAHLTGECGRQVGHGGGWECAVEWLLQYPDERGVFREILSFL